MFKNYLIIGLRHLVRPKLFSAINVLCLGIGICFTMLIAAYVINEKQVNAGLSAAGDQYILKSKWKQENSGLDITTIAPLARALKESYPDLVENYYRYNPVTNVVSAGDNHYKEEISIGDTTLVSMYGFKLLYGNSRQAFANNNSAVITEDLATRLFGSPDAINKTITITTTTSQTQDYLVSGVLKQIPKNSVTHIISPTGYSVFLPFKGSRYFQVNDLEESWANTYVLGMIRLRPGVKPEQLAKPAADLVANRADASIKGNIKVELAPVRSYYLKDNNAAVERMITTLLFVAGFILLMAVINFVNISIGTSSYRLKEIGLRKVFGSERKQLIFQYLTESMALTIAAGVLSVFFYQLLLPYFGQVMNTTLPSVWQFTPGEILLLTALILSTGFVAGIYPAFVLSASNTVAAIKGKMNTAKSALVFRRTLLVVQFTLAIIVFISAVNISRQVNYCFTRDLGYDKERLMAVYAFPKQWDSAGVLKMEAIRDAFKQLPGVKNASLAFEVPDRKPPVSYDLVPEGSDARPVYIPGIAADANYAATFGLTLKEGSFFKTDGGYTPRQLVLNESAVKALGLTGPVTGKKIRLPSANVVFTVAGVIKDYHYSTFQETAGPVVFAQVMDTKNYRFLTVKLQGGDIARSISLLKNKWQSMARKAPFDFFFMDDKFQLLYQSELQLQRAARMATVLMIIIVLTGIFGIVTFTLVKRTREIAVRKVLGAGAGNIISLFLKDYALLLLIANIIAWPLAFRITGKWLENYVYRIEQSWSSFLAVALVTFAAALLCISFQCYRAALANPVKNLRTE
ncbi:MAG: ABC transporter permease [Chitinophagaceae bacterium]|nr:ABC transporter permease [Chitinophagaceae bacterium]